VDEKLPIDIEQERAEALEYLIRVMLSKLKRTKRKNKEIRKMINHLSRNKSTDKTQKIGEKFRISEKNSALLKNVPLKRGRGRPRKYFRNN
jgi:hypothetical protein